MADDIASLGFAIDSTPVKKATDDLANMAPAANKATDATDKFTASVNKATTATGAANAAAAKHAATVMNTEREVAGLSRAIGVLAQEFESGAQSLGRLGSFLISFGPMGVAAGVGIATVVFALKAITDAADQLGQKSIQMQAFATITGLTTDQIQVLDRTAGELGVQSGTVSTFLERLSVNMTALKTASGPLYTDLLKINPSLAEQAIHVKSLSELLTLLARAYADAGSKGNALLVAAGGRSGASAAPLFDAIASAGSMDQLVANMSKFITLTNTEVKAFADFDAKLKTIKDTNADLFGKLFASNTEAARKEFHEGWVRTVLETLADMKKAWATPAPTFLSVPEQERLKKERDMAFQEGATPSGAITTPNTTPLGLEKPDPVQLANQIKELNAALGSGATAADALKARLLEIAALDADHKFQIGGLTEAQGAANKARAEGAAILDNQIARTTALVGVLGPLASVDQVVLEKTQALAKYQATYGELLPGVAANILAVTRAQADGTLTMKAQADALTVQTSALMMTAGAAAAYTAEQSKINEYARLGKAPTAEESAAWHAKATEIGAATDRLETYKTVIGGINAVEGNLTTGLADIVDGTKTVSQGFTDMSKTIIRSIEEMIIKMTISIPIANALKSSLSGFLPGVGAAPATGSGWAPGVGETGPVPVGHSGGMIGELTAARYVHPAYFDDAPRFGGGGIVGGERAVVAHDGEGIFTAGQMKAMGGAAPPVNITVINNGASVDVGQPKSDGNGGLNLEITVDAMVAKSMAKPGSQTNNTMRNRFGVAQVPVRR